MENKFQLLDAIIKSRLLSLNESGYEEILKINVDSFRRRYENSSDEKLNVIYDAFSEALNDYDAYEPEYMINAYIKASDVYNSVGFDWGKKKDIRARKTFCRWMFRQAYLSNTKLHEETYYPFDEDWGLLKLFKPEPEDTKESINIVFTMLLTFQIVEPFGSDRERKSRQDRSHEHRDNMIKLLEQLQKDLPSFGVFKDLHSLKKALNLLKDTEIDDTEFPPAAYWGLLNNIACELSVISSPKELSDSHIEIDGYVMGGIWIDDYEDGQKRFWVFPNNKLMAFCYYLRNDEWILQPYEFGFYRMDYELEFDEICFMATSKGNMQAFLKGKIEENEFARLRYELDDRDEEGMFQTIRFSLESGSEYPDWMPWRSFRRLNVSDKRFKEFLNDVKIIYHRSELLRNFTNNGSWLTDSNNCLIGLDAEFLYLSDIAVRGGGILEIDEDENDYPIFNYYVKYANPNQNLNLFSVEVSKRQPLYAVARDSHFYEELDKTLNLNSEKLKRVKPDREERKALIRKYKDFKDIVENVEYNNQITIYKNLRGESSVLCFNAISRIFDLDEIIEWFGVKKFESRDALLNSEIFKWNAGEKRES